MNHSKSSISIMYAGQGFAVLLPEYILCKVSHFDESWTVAGSYNKSMLDSLCSENWAEEIVIPYISRLP
jgi:hypothetical protein